MRALAAGLYELLTDRAAPADGAPDAWPKRLSAPMVDLLKKALGSRRFTAKAFAEGLTRILEQP